MNDHAAGGGSSGGSGKAGKGKPAAAAPTNFIRNIIAADLARGTYEPRNWGGKPGVYDLHAKAPADPAKIRTRFPPEPNGYLHIGHGKSICLNFGLARDFGGRCHMRFDDTNPVKEDQEFVDGILGTVRWLGFDWEHGGESNLYHASDYFEDMYRFAEHLIATGYAYVDEQSADETRAARGTLTERGTDSPFRDRPIEESLRLFREMRAGKHPEGSMILRAKIDMGSPNINMRDPAIYRIRFAEHHMTGDAWKVYPMYAYAHPIEDALENITHSICTLEFEDQRPFYDWVLERIVPLLRKPQYEAAKAKLDEIRVAGVEAKREFALHCRNVAAERPDKLGASRYERRAEAMFASWSKSPDLAASDADEFFKLLCEHTECFTPLLQHALDDFTTGGKLNPFMLPHQHEFNRLNLTYVVMSKRKLIQLVQDGHVDGWDDPRMPTLVGLRRRGYTPQAIQGFMDRIGVSKSTQWIDYSVLEQALRDDLDARAPRATAVLKPLKLILDNYPEGSIENVQLPVHPQNPSLGTRTIPFARELWIEADDFMENAPADYFRLALGKDGAPGNPVRLRYAYVIRATSVEKDAAGSITAVHAEYLPETKSGSPGQNSVKTKTAIHWLPVHGSIPAEVRVFERLFTDPHPDAGEGNFLDLLNPNSKQVLKAYVEPSLANAQPDDKFQFERNGYFVADLKDHARERPVFNLAVSLKDSWAK
jgi:glutaminyl-tRNA synthetase